MIVKSFSTTRKRLIIDIKAAQKAYNQDKISNIWIIGTEHNLADGLTKNRPNKSLERLFDTGVIDLNI